MRRDVKNLEIKMVARFRNEMKRPKERTFVMALKQKWRQTSKMMLVIQQFFFFGRIDENERGNEVYEVE